MMTFRSKPCLCGHGESCKNCSPYYQERNDPVWLRARLDHAMDIIRAARPHCVHTSVEEDIDEWLLCAKEGQNG
jgi:hypothetical protein